MFGIRSLSPILTVTLGCYALPVYIRVVSDKVILVSRFNNEAVLISNANEKNLKGSYTKTTKEIDFVASKGSKKVYIQSALALPDEAKTEQELRPFSLTGDSFPKIIVRRDIRKKWYDDNGVLNIGLSEFLLDEDSI